jgi:hypothetical protein
MYWEGQACEAIRAGDGRRGDEPIFARKIVQKPLTNLKIDRKARFK